MTGGDRLGDKGYYIQPTIFSDVQVIKLRITSKNVSTDCPSPLLPHLLNTYCMVIASG